jgi:predicted TIM-barrel fold metal-dependent hydrolase
MDMANPEVNGQHQGKNARPEVENLVDSFLDQLDLGDFENEDDKHLPLSELAKKNSALAFDKLGEVLANWIGAPQVPQTPEEMREMIEEVGRSSVTLDMRTQHEGLVEGLNGMVDSLEKNMVIDEIAKTVKELMSNLREEESAEEARFEKLRNLYQDYKEGLKEQFGEKLINEPEIQTQLTKVETAIETIEQAMSTVMDHMRDMRETEHGDTPERERLDQLITEQKSTIKKAMQQLENGVNELKAILG